MIEVKDMDEAAEVATSYAAEHLEIMTENPEKGVRERKSGWSYFSWTMGLQNLLEIS